MFVKYWACTTNTLTCIKPDGKVVFNDTGISFRFAGHLYEVPYDSIFALQIN